jgi:hypothetical protein
MIQCNTASSASGSAVYCFARNSEGTTASCYSSNQELVANARSLSGDGHVLFYYDTNGQCTYIYATHSSVSRPK